ncbi:hypothetical protein MBLNU13_g10315t1 [Cladosporium sp. NU13]
MEVELDNICLDFCIALHDHDLKGDLYESAVLGYLAVMGIDNNSARFYEAHSYTPLLSGFIKISQMLVLESAFRACEKKRSADPLDLLEEMRERFMTIDCRTPFSWTIQLRSFGKKIRDSTTSIGYIQWSEDEKTLFYKDLELRISDFQAFVRAQVVVAQRLLEEIIMLHPEENREDVVPPLHLHTVRDNPTVTDNSWNFLQDNRNKASLPDRSTWMLRRVLDNEWLRDEFVSTDTYSKVEWKPKALQGYRRQVDCFLEHLLLLVHLTSGQPARGTEIISLRHVNTIHHRNLFVEDGLVAIVTSYHKGYTCTGSTKIIHRYLPREVGELLVYYLWLILPFAKQVAQLAPGVTKKIPDSFLWSQGEHTTNQKHLFFQAQKEDVKKTASDLAEAAKIVQGFDNHRATVVPWLRETGIVKHIAQLKKDEIKAAIALPSSGGENELRTIIDAMESLLREAHGLCFDGTECMLTWPCRVVLSRFQSTHVDIVGRTRAFDPYKEPGTLKSYFGISQRFLSYFHRVVFPDEYYFDIVDTDEEVERPEDVVEATDEQLAVWNDIWQIAKQECQSEDDEEKKQTELKNRLLEMWMLIIGHNTGARRYQSPLLSFCAMLSIKPSTKGWLEPGNFNSHLSPMIWVVQLLIFYDSARKEQQGQGQTLQLVKRFCGRYLQQAVETPMGEILRWRLLLFKISKESIGDHEASWDENEQVLTYEDTELHMDQIPTLLESEYQDCHRLLYNDLMMSQTTIGRMHSWALKDGPNVDTIDWNFTQHRDNANLIGGADTALLSAIDRSEHLSRVFLSADTRTSNGFA